MKRVFKIRIYLQSILGIFLLFLFSVCTLPNTKSSSDSGSNSTGLGAPTFSPVSGTYTTTQNVTISSTSDTTIIYTTDGSTPTSTNGLVYTGPINVSSSTTINAIAIYIINLKGLKTSSSVAFSNYTITGSVATPAISPSGGTYTTAQNVSISCTTSGATIRYTTDGSTPSETYGTIYTGSVIIANTTTLKAIAYKNSWADSSVVTAVLTIFGTVATPTVSPSGGTYTTAQNVSISCTTSGATIRYTTDGSTPSETYGTIYTGSVIIANTTTLKAIAYKNSWADSSVVTAVLTIFGTVATPTVSPSGGTYTTAQNVTLSCLTNGTTIRYTTDGSIPTETYGTIYTGSIVIANTTTLKAIAYKSGWTDSSIATIVFTICVATPTISPSGGTYTTAQNITLSCTTSGASIRYTTDRSIPTETYGTIYSGLINISSTATLNAVAYKTGWTDSSVATAIYTISGSSSPSWSALGSGMNAYGWVETVAFDSLGNLYAGGFFTTAGGITANGIAKWNGTSWSALGLGISGAVNGSCCVTALTFDGSGNLYIGGCFTNAGGITVNGIAKWNGTSWSALGSGMNSDVYALVCDNAGNLYAGGVFTTAGGATANGIAKWNGTSWSALGSGISGVVGGSLGIYALAVDKLGNLYAGGAFKFVGDTPVNCISKWDGMSWSALGSGLGDVNSVCWVDALTFDGPGNLYAGGLFSTAGGNSAGCIAKWNGTSWSGLGIGMNNGIGALAFDSSGNLYAGGAFTSVDYTTINYIAKWSGTSWSALGSDLSGGLSVDAITFDSLGNLYAGSDFTTAGGTAVNYIAKWGK